ncbi:MAG: hypothetical protein ACFB0B_15490 [Thermonemataceae bacterium]
MLSPLTTEQMEALQEADSFLYCYEVTSDVTAEKAKHSLRAIVNAGLLHDEECSKIYKHNVEQLIKYYKLEKY